MRYCIYCGKQIGETDGECGFCKRAQPPRRQLPSQPRPMTREQIEAKKLEEWMRYRRYIESQKPSPSMPRRYKEPPKKYPRKKGGALFTQIFGCVAAFICLIALVLSLTVLPTVSCMTDSGKTEYINTLDLMKCAKNTVISAPKDKYGNDNDYIPFHDTLAEKLAYDYFHGNVKNAVPVLLFAVGVIISAILTLICAVYFIHSLIGLFSERFSRVRYECTALRFASLAAGVIAVLQFIAPLALNTVIPYGTGFTLIACAAVFVLSLLEALFCLLFISEEAKSETKRTLSSALAAVFCVLIIMFSFTPYAVSGGAVQLYDGERIVFYQWERDDFFTLTLFKDKSEGGLEGTENDTPEGLKQSYLEIKKSFKYYTYDDVKSGKTDVIDESIIVYSLSGVGAHKHLEVYGVISAVFAPLCIACTLFLSEMLKYLYFADTDRRRYKIAKISLAATGGIAYAAVLAFASLAEYTMLRGSAGYFVSPSLTVLLSLGMTVAILLMKTGRKKLTPSEIKRPYMFEYKYLDY